MKFQEFIDIETLNIGETKREIERVELDHEIEDGYKEKLKKHLRELRELLKAEYEPDIERPSFRVERFRKQMNDMSSPFSKR